MNFDEVVLFHGHRCPGLAIGYRMAQAAMRTLDVSRAGDEELVATVENDACGVDALQFLTGCTFGKGNLIFRDYGKPVFTLYSRSRNLGVRVRFLDVAIPAELRGDRAGRLQYILSAAEETILSISTVAVTEPKKASIFTTVICDNCHESVMDTRLRSVAGRKICIPCAEATATPGEAE